MQAAPNPQLGSPVTLAVKLLAAADSVEIKIYSSALTNVATLKASAAFSAGWNAAAFAPDQPLAAGLYFVKLYAKRADGSKVLYRHTVKLVVLP